MMPKLTGLTCATGTFLLALGGCTASPESPSTTAGGDDRYGDGGVSAFYTANTAISSIPGTLIQHEDMDLTKLPQGASRGVRVLYSSQNGVNKSGPVAVSGQVLFPKGKAPVGGWPVVAWEHGTTGVADVCAPSWRGYSSRDKAYLSRWLSEGFVVVATDYQGLGTPGPHPYLFYRPEGYSVLNGLRASLSAFPKEIKNWIVLVGQSQGSGAALGAAWLAPSYAAELNIRGVVATGLVTGFAAPPGARHVPIPEVYTDASKMDSAFAMLRVEGSDQSLQPETDSRTVLTSAGRQMSQIARHACLHNLFDKADQLKVQSNALFNEKLPAFEAGHDAAFTIPNAKISFPVFAGTGLADGEAGVNGQYNAVAAMCDAGTHVLWKRYPGMTHNGAVNVSLKDSIPFVKTLLAGHMPPQNCASIKPPGPVEEALPNVPWNN
ncbi:MULTISPECIES: lipase family protein [Gluconobacter]|uniref:lipase family protein n=1 Tax=Gluconobacter TaxID=441 RepID=UPI00201390DB|nr:MULTISPECIES: lipase family protein [Gluconobacter]